jgi:hypothetical protein
MNKEVLMRIRSIAVAAALILIAACGPYKPGVNQAAMQEKEKIILLDHGLTYYLNVVKQGAARLPGGQLQVKLEMENEEDKDVWTDVQVIFRGADGFELEKTDWQPFMFHRRTVTLFQQNSLNTAAADYRVLIRNAKSN